MLFNSTANLYLTVCLLGRKVSLTQGGPKSCIRITIIILYYAIYGSTQIQKAKIHLKYDLKYKKDINTNIKAHSSARNRATAAGPAHNADASHRRQGVY